MKHQSFRETPEYKLWRRKVWYRDGYKCRVCSSKIKPEAHHIFPAKLFPKKIYEFANGITLCKKHHRAIKGKELLIAKYLQAVLENGVKSVNPRTDKAEGNTEPSLDRNIKEGVTTRSRDFHIDQFISKQVKCKICGELKKVPYYRTINAKFFICNKEECKHKAWKGRLAGKDHPKWKPAKINKCLWCGKNTSTPSDKNRIKKFCDNICQMAYWNNQVGWSRKHKKCIICGTTTIKHKGNGMCETCHRANRYKVNNTSKNAPPEREEIV